MIQSGGTAFEQGGDQHDVVGGGYLTVEAGGRTGDGLCQVEQTGVFRLTEIRCVMEFLEYNQLRTGLCHGGNVAVQLFEVLFEVGGTGLLYEADADGSFHDSMSFLTDSGYCMVTQWREPCCWMRARQSTPTISRPGKASASTCAARASFAGWA